MYSSKIKRLVGLAMLTAIVVVLQLVGSFIRFGPFSISLVLIPIVVGAALYGAKGGAWLGFIFGVVVLASGDAASFLAISPIGTVVTVLVKGVCAGLCAGLVYGMLAKTKNRYLAVAAAAVVCPIVNTGVFLLGCFAFFMEAIISWSGAAAFGVDVLTYMLVGFIGLNFVFELVTNVILSPVAVRIIHLIKDGK